MPGTPTMPRPATVITACAGSTASDFTGYAFSDCRDETSVPGAAGSMNERTRTVMRVPAIGINARGCSTLAP
jgi:hypothetical protein